MANPRRKKYKEDKSWVYILKVKLWKLERQLDAIQQHLADENINAIRQHTSQAIKLIRWMLKNPDQWDLDQIYIPDSSPDAKSGSLDIKYGKTSR